MIILFQRTIFLEYERAKKNSKFYWEGRTEKPLLLYFLNSFLMSIPSCNTVSFCYAHLNSSACGMHFEFVVSNEAPPFRVSFWWGNREF